MSRYRVIVRPSARRHAAAIKRWLDENRGTSEVFVGELEAALRRIASVPAAPFYGRFSGRDVRRLLLPRSSYQLFFEVREPQKVVGVLAVWHTSRGQGPDL